MIKRQNTMYFLLADILVTLMKLEKLKKLNSFGSYILKFTLTHVY